MAFRVHESDALLEVVISGMLTYSEFMAMHKELGAILQKREQSRVLVRGEGFEGWGKGGEWGDLSFQVNDVFIEKMALVVDPQWQDLAEIFTGKGMRRFPIEVFASAEADHARLWLGSISSKE